MFSIRFTNFWENSEHSQKTFFIPLLELVFQDRAKLVLDPETHVDLEVESVFKPKVHPILRKLRRSPNFNIPIHNLYEVDKTSKSNRKIWYSGENLRPPLFREFDSYLCFDDNALAENVHYLPLWVLNIDWFHKSLLGKRVSLMPKIEPLLQARTLGSKLDTGGRFCCSFIGIAENMRLNAVHALSSIDQIEIFGRAVKRLVPDKVEAAKEFKFILAFENTLYPGYVTEKLIEAYISNAIPIYWGVDNLKYFNPNSFINLSEFHGMAEFVEQVRKIHANTDLYQYHFEQALFQKKFSLSDLVIKLQNDLL